jgi:fructokinase
MMKSSPVAPAPPLVFGEVLVDSFEDGGRVLGGAPFNVAWHLQAFGAEPILVSRVGNDAVGAEILEAMRRWGLSVEGMQVDPKYPTGEVVVTLTNGQPTFRILPDQAYDFVEAAPLHCPGPALVYHGTLAIRSSGAAAAFVDINLREPWWRPERVARCLDVAHWAKLNESELLALTGQPSDGEADGSDTHAMKVETQARALMREHPLALLIVTMGEQGAMALDRGGACVRVSPARRVEVTDTVGAGDAFASVCILGLLGKWSLEVLLERAQAFASRVVGIQGATIEDRSLYERVIEQWAGAET